jgi:hypothetical protein
MSFLKSAMKAGIAKKVFDEARKPKNQQMVKDLVAKARGKGSRGSAPPRG